MSAPQFDLFGQAKAAPPRAPTGRELKELALADLTARVRAGWILDAVSLLRTFCGWRIELGTDEFRMEEFREWAAREGLGRPRTHHLWGTLPTIAAKQGLIVWTGRFEPAHSPATHNHPVRVWRAIGGR